MAAPTSQDPMMSHPSIVKYDSETSAPAQENMLTANTEHEKLAGIRQEEEEGRKLFDDLSEEHREEIIEIFNLVDHDNDDYLGYDDLKVGLQALGSDIAEPDIVAILSVHGISDADIVLLEQESAARPPTETTGDPCRLFLSKTKFMSIAAKMVSERNPRDEFNRGFDLIDQDQKGFIDLEDLRRVVRQNGAGIEDEELHATIEHFGVRGKGGINRATFVQMCLPSEHRDQQGHFCRDVSSG